MVKVELKVNNTVYTGWTEVTLTKSIEAASGSFALKCGVEKPLPIKDEDSIEILLFGQTVLRGYADKTKYVFNAKTLTFDITGRDFACDIIDCSAVNNTSQFLGITFEELARRLLKPFNIPIKVETARAKKVIAKVSFQQETVYAILEREARKVGVLVYSDYSGAIVISDIGTRVVDTRLTCPGNILGFDYSTDSSQRFSDYIVKAQQSKSKDSSLEQVTQVTAKAHDPNVARHRPLIIMAESNMTWQQAKDRVEWEAAVRAARCRELTVLLDSWIDASNKLWEINTQVSISLDSISLVNQMYVIKSATFRLTPDQTGVTTELTLVDKDLLKPQPIVPKKEKTT